jgi:hypothetical protein
VTTTRNIGLGAGVCAALAAAPALAQNRSSDAADEMIVLGTYIKRPSQFDAPSPLVILSTDAARARSAT